ncbi:hypothetical protein ACFWCO_22940, partial [Streptomyces diastaticus]|uniref:hypothetical protein n=1 Tax=Streptomyces diastaticus TaxID=1956 RepID=UPI0036A81A70
MLPRTARVPPAHVVLSGLFGTRLRRGSSPAGDGAPCPPVAARPAREGPGGGRPAPGGRGGRAPPAPGAVAHAERQAAALGPALSVTTERAALERAVQFTT